jgi:hypothetical protein
MLGFESVNISIVYRARTKDERRRMKREPT